MIAILFEQFDIVNKNISFVVYSFLDDTFFFLYFIKYFIPIKIGIKPNKFRLEKGIKLIPYAHNKQIIIINATPKIFPMKIFFSHFGLQFPKNTVFVSISSAFVPMYVKNIFNIIFSIFVQLGFCSKQKFYDIDGVIKIKGNTLKNFIENKLIIDKSGLRKVFYID